MFIGRKKIIPLQTPAGGSLQKCYNQRHCSVSIEETEEQIVPSHNTVHDGIYYKFSEDCVLPPESFNAKQQARRQELYSTLSDPITSHIAVIRDRLANGEYSSED
jgi:hypothetical protein